jgi:hypothetical protein
MRCYGWLGQGDSGNNTAGTISSRNVPASGRIYKKSRRFQVRLVRHGVYIPCVTRWLPFYLDDNMGAEQDANLHQPVADLEEIRDTNPPSLHFPLLFPHGELVGI